MSKDLELCPECNQGHLKPTGRGSVGSEKPGEIRDNDSMRDLECDKCGHKQKNAGLYEHGEPSGDQLSGTATRANPREKE